MIHGYRIIKQIGKGGMGEVFLVYDPVCDRKIALKRARSNVSRPEILKTRFLKEAKITARLVHPGVIPIYSICEGPDSAYYTMPYVEGRTLKQLFKQVWGRNPELCREELRECTSISELTRVFYTLCRTMEYVHSEGILHRDLKPDNILIGLFGEVIILDWGVSVVIGDFIEEKETPGRTNFLGEKTSPGKIAGTPNYMPPERLRGARANEQSDIYALGVILYQILTLQFPFHRTIKTIKKFKNASFSDFPISPEEAAPYRDIPAELSKIALKALADDPQSRYASVKELITDLSSYMEGTPTWSFKSRLLIDQRDCWEIKENILFTGHLAITGIRNQFNWLGIAISKELFSEDIKLETCLNFSSLVLGLGFLFSVPGAIERKHLYEGYCLWLQYQDGGLSVSLFKNSVEIIRSGKIPLRQSKQYSVVIEKRHNKLVLYIDGESLFNYVSHLPDVGGHIGLLFKELELSNGEIKVFESSHNLYINCLAIPNAFLADKNYDKALSLYKQIAISFPGRVESREAMFYAGLTLLEKGKQANCKRIFDTCCTEALEFFSSLHTVSGGPLEYLGKSIVYHISGEIEEEVKCLELGIRRYSNHPLVSRLKEHLIYRVHEAAEKDRKSAYLFLLTISKLESERNEGCHRLFQDLMQHWEDPPLETSGQFFVPLGLSYWLSSQNGLSYFFNLATSCKDLVSCRDAVYAIYALGANPDLLMEENKLFFEVIQNEGSFLFGSRDFFYALHYIDTGNFEEACNILLQKSFKESDLVRLIFLLINQIYFMNSDYPILPFLEEMETSFSPEILKFKIFPKKIFIYLSQGRAEDAFKLLDIFSYEEIADDFLEIFTLYGCWLAMTEGEESAIIHFSGISERIFPKSFTLLAYYITQGDRFSEKNLFRKERLILYSYQSLYYSCLNNSEAMTESRRKWKELRSSPLS